MILKLSIISIMGMDNSSLDCEKELLQQVPVDLARASVCSKAYHRQDKEMIEDEDPMPEDEVIPEDNEVVPEEDYCEDVLKSADTGDIDEVHQDMYNSIFDCEKELHSTFAE